MSQYSDIISDGGMDPRADYEAKRKVQNLESSIKDLIDCGLNQVLEIDEDGSCAAIDTGLPNFYLVGQEKRKKKLLDKIGAYDYIYKNL